MLFIHAFVTYSKVENWLIEINLKALILLSTRGNTKYLYISYSAPLAVIKGPATL